MVTDFLLRRKRKNPERTQATEANSCELKGDTSRITHLEKTGKFFQGSLRQSQVFQLDPLRGEDAPDTVVTSRQHAISGAILQGITNMLNGTELDSNLRDSQLEITQVKTTPDLRHATIYWTVPDEMRYNQENIQNLLNENTDYVRRLLPAYSSLSRFPQLVFIKDNSAEYEEEMEHLIQKARNTDRYTGIK